MKLIEYIIILFAVPCILLIVFEASDMIDIDSKYYTDIFLDCNMKDDVDDFYTMTCKFNSHEFQYCIRGRSTVEAYICHEDMTKTIEVYDLNMYTVVRSDKNKTELIDNMKNYFELSDRLREFPMIINGELYE